MFLTIFTFFSGYLDLICYCFLNVFHLWTLLSLLKDTWFILLTCSAPGCPLMISRGISPSWRCATWPPTRCRGMKGTAGRCRSTRVAGWEEAPLVAVGTSQVGFVLFFFLISFYLFKRWRCLNSLLYNSGLFLCRFLSSIIGHCAADLLCCILQTRSGQTLSIGCSCMRRMTTQRTTRWPALLSWHWCRKVEGCSATKGPCFSPSASPSMRWWSRVIFPPESMRVQDFRC